MSYSGRFLELGLGKLYEVCQTLAEVRRHKPTRPERNQRFYRVSLEVGTGGGGNFPMRFAPMGPIPLMSLSCLAHTTPEILWYICDQAYNTKYGAVEKGNPIRRVWSLPA